MTSRRKQFYGRTFVIKKKPIFLVLLCGFVVTALLSSNISLNFPETGTKIYRRCISYTIASFPNESTSLRLFFNPFHIISVSTPVIKANEALNRKYATRYSYIKEDTKKNTAAKNEDILLAGNILETDLSTNSFTFINPTNYAVNAEELLALPLAVSPLSDTPRVLIVHTHTSEAYSDSPGARSEDPSFNVVSVGAEIAKTLSENGVNVIHDTTRNDYPSYNGSYKKCLETITNNLNRYPSIEIVLDIHRDYIERDSQILKPTATFENEKAAQIMFVIGTDSMGLTHPDWRSNLSLAVKMQKELLTHYPTLCRAINIRTERFNQHVTKGSMIIEVGSSANTLSEAQNSGRYIGEALADILKKL